MTRWRQRYERGGVDALLTDRRRPGRKPRLSEATVREVVEWTLHELPRETIHWSTRSMAVAVGLSPATVRRIWKAHGLKPHLTRTFKLSTDPQFVDKLRDVVGLYVSPPEHALVLSVD